jgi:hypothetical protein
MGGDAHGGLDINHPAGTRIWAPISLDRQGLFDSIDAGASNNRWAGYRMWTDEWTWRVGVHHVARVFPASGEPLEAGAVVAEGASIAVGAHEHSHFTFGVIPPGCTENEMIRLDPWILFWQMYQDRAQTSLP